MDYSITLASFRKIEPMGETVSRLEAIGFDSVEMFGEPDQVDLKQLKDAIATTKLRVCGITGMWGRASRKGSERRLLSLNQRIVVKSEHYVKECIKMCNQLGGNEINICLFADEAATGGQDMTHTFVSSQEKDKMLSRAPAILRALCREASDYGIRLVLEPLNRYSTPYCNTASDAIGIATKVDGLGILLDTFHMNIEEDSFENAISASKDLLIHTHFADNNRKMPGMAHTDFATIMKSLKAINYKNCISFEPNIASKAYEDELRFGLEHIRNLENVFQSTSRPDL